MAQGPVLEVWGLRLGLFLRNLGFEENQGLVVCLFDALFFYSLGVVFVKGFRVFCLLSVFLSKACR